MCFLKSSNKRVKKNESETDKFLISTELENEKQKENNNKKSWVCLFALIILKVLFSYAPNN